MAYFAQIVNGTVVGVTVVNDSDCGGGGFPESEIIGQQFMAGIGMGGQFLQTDIDGAFRGKYAAIGDVYDEFSDVFVTPDSITVV